MIFGVGRSQKSRSGWVDDVGAWFLRTKTSVIGIPAQVSVLSGAGRDLGGLGERDSLATVSPASPPLVFHPSSSTYLRTPLSSCKHRTSGTGIVILPCKE
jgi:hypothetical protein